jgi:hypothetical protein
MPVEALVVSARDGGSRFEVFVKPRASKTKITGVREGALVVSLAAPPVDGAANAELVSALAAALGVRRSDVVIASGAASRTKIVDIANLAPADLRIKLGLE